MSISTALECRRVCCATKSQEIAGWWPTFSVGTTSLHLTDTARPDPWAAGVNARELMVSLWYPAAPSDGRPARYMTPAESELQLTSRGITGYVVAGIDHTYESFATAFPDGRVTTCLARRGPRRDTEKVAAGRAADVSFVVGELTGAHPASQGAALIDPSRMAMAGHSVGGATAIAVMLADSRIRAGIDMDGGTAATIPDHGLSRPFLFFGRQSKHAPMSGPSSTSTCSANRKRCLTSRHRAIRRSRSLPRG